MGGLDLVAIITHPIEESSFAPWECLMTETAIAASKVLDALRTVMDPDLNRDIVSLNFVRNMKIEGSVVSST